VGTLWKDLLKLAHPTSYGMDHEEYHNLPHVEDEDVLQSRDCLLHPQRDRP